MLTIDARELQRRIPELLQRVQEQGEPVELAVDGVVVQIMPGLMIGVDDEPLQRVIRPTHEVLADMDRLAAEIGMAASIPPSAPFAEYVKGDTLEVLAEMDRIAERIGALWPEGVSAADAINDIRREL